MQALGSTTTWYCFSSPPIVLTSMTPCTSAQLGHDLPVEQRAQLHRRVVIDLTTNCRSSRGPTTPARARAASRGRQLALRRAGARARAGARTRCPCRPRRPPSPPRARRARCCGARRCRDAVERVLDRGRDGALDLDGREARRAREHRDLHGRDVGQRVDGQRARRERAERGARGGRGRVRRRMARTSWPRASDRVLSGRARSSGRRRPT